MVGRGRRISSFALAGTLALLLGCGKKDTPSGPATCPDPAAPAAPTALTPTPAIGSIALAWQNPTDSDFAGVRLLRRTGSAPTSHHDATATLVYEGTLQAVTDNGLASGTVYHYAIWAFDSCDPPNYSPTPMTTFATPGQPAPPPAPTGASITAGVHQITVRWTNPVSTYFSGVVVRRKPNAVPSSPTDGTLVYSGSGSQIADDNAGAGLTPNVTYCYAIFARDTYGQFSVSPAPACGVPNYEYQTFDIPSLTMDAEWPDTRCGGDDCDFSAQGPVVTLSAAVQRTGPNIFVQVTQFRAVQDGGDLTCSEKGSNVTWRTNSWMMPDGWTFDRYVTTQSETVMYTDTGPGVDMLTGTDLLLVVRLFGDTAGDDVCGTGADDTHVVSLSTRTIQVQLRR